MGQAGAYADTLSMAIGGSSLCHVLCALTSLAAGIVQVPAPLLGPGEAIPSEESSHVDGTMLRFVFPASWATNIPPISTPLLEPLW